MPRRLGRKLMLSITVIVIIVAAVSGLVNIKTEERQLLDTMILGADQLSKGITSATWHVMRADNREAAYQVMQTIAKKLIGIKVVRSDGSRATVGRIFWLRNVVNTLITLIPTTSPILPAMPFGSRAGSGLESKICSFWPLQLVHAPGAGLPPRIRL